MSDPYIIDENNVEDDALRLTIKSYKEAMRRFDQDLDVDFFLKTLEAAQEDCVLKIARNPVDENHEWVTGTVLHNVGKVYVDDDHHLTLRIRRDNVELTVAQMFVQYDKLKKELPGTMGPVMLELSDEKKVQITDIYSHAIVKNVYAGLPFEVVLGYFEKDSESASKEKAESEPKEEAEPEA